MKGGGGSIIANEDGTIVRGFIGNDDELQYLINNLDKYDNLSDLQLILQFNEEFTADSKPNMKPLFEKIASKNLKKFLIDGWLNTYKLSYDDCSKLYSSLQFMLTLEELKLIGCGIDNNISGIIWNLLEMPTNITTLDMRYNRIGNDSVPNLVRVLKDNKVLVKLDLKDNQIGDKSIPELLELFKNNTTLLNLDIGYNNFTREGIDKLSNAFFNR